MDVGFFYIQHGKCTITCVIHVPHIQNSYFLKLYFITLCHRYWKLDEERNQKYQKSLPSSKLSHKLEKIFKFSLEKTFMYKKFKTKIFIKKKHSQWSTWSPQINIVSFTHNEALMAINVPKKIVKKITIAKFNKNCISTMIFFLGITNHPWEPQWTNTH